MSRVRRSDSFTRIDRNRERSAISSAGLSCRISENARIDVNGVRSSWVTVEMKSSLSRSSSFSRALASRKSRVAASNSVCFSFNSWL